MTYINECKYMIVLFNEVFSIYNISALLKYIQMHAFAYILTRLCN